MIITKTIHCKVIGLTKKKQQLLNKEYLEAVKLSNLLNEARSTGNMLNFNYKNVNAELYSLTKSGILFKASRARQKRGKLLYLYAQSIRIKKTENKLSKFWMKIPIYKVFGGIWIALQFSKKYENLLENGKLKSSIVSKKNGNYYVYLCLEKDVQIMDNYQNILAVDLGEKVMATVCGSFDKGRPRFFGREVRGIRRHYAWLYKRLGERRLLKKIKSIGQTEKRKVDSVLHKISSQIVKLAEQNNAIIVLGELKGIRKSAKGKKMRRIVSSMPYHKLTHYIEYKANWAGIAVKRINEKNTSKTCSNCGQLGIRKTQGSFVCHGCGYQANADHNGAKNILKRSLEYISKDGAIGYAQKFLKEGVSTTVQT
ncbi:MAG: transposase [archaeon]|nr:transposase [archaeon]